MGPWLRGDEPPECEIERDGQRSPDRPDGVRFVALLERPAPLEDPGVTGERGDRDRRGDLVCGLRRAQNPQVLGASQGLLQPGDAVLELDDRLGEDARHRGVPVRAGEGRAHRAPRARREEPRARRPPARIRRRRRAGPAPGRGRAESRAKLTSAITAVQPGSAATRKVAVLAADGVDAGSLRPVLDRLREQARSATSSLLTPASLRAACTSTGPSRRWRPCSTTRCWLPVAGKA